jgi:sec-independent protein translocase protein TatB
MPFLDNLDGWKLLVLALLGIFIFGPDKLPKAIADGVKMLRNLREMARNATGDLSRELGTDIQLEDLNPKAFIRKHVLSEDDEQALRRPLEDLYKGVRDDVQSLATDAKKTTTELTSATAPAAATSAAAVSDRPARQSFDLDAT